MLLLAIIGFSTFSYSQSSDSLLQKTISIQFRGSTLFQALNQIGENAGCFFIYDSKDLKSDKKVQNRKYENKSVEDVLNQIISDTLLGYRVIDSHILIFRKQDDQFAIAEEKPDSIFDVVVRGTVIDRETLKPIPFATISIQDLGLGTISNYEGVFSLRIPQQHKNASVMVSHLGYENLQVPIAILQGKNYELFIQPRFIPIQEVIIRNIDAKGIVKSISDNKSKNYFDEDVYLTSFYREGVKRNDKYIGYTEAVFKTYKTSYDRGVQFDQVRLLKSRKIDFADRRDTLVMRLKAGVKGALDLDVVKSLPDFLDPEFMDDYTYAKTDIVVYDNKSAYAISFEQKPGIDLPMFVGTIYVDIESLALLGADFMINPKLIEKSTNLFVVKKDKNVNVTPEEVKYSVRYRAWKGKYYIHHIRGDLSFRVKERRKLFSSRFSVFLEYVNMQLDTLNVQRFSRREVLRPTIIFSEENYEYDADFWGDFNTISPEEDISKAISRISPKIETTENVEELDKNGR